MILSLSVSTYAQSSSSNPQNEFEQNELKKKPKLDPKAPPPEIEKEKKDIPPMNEEEISMLKGSKDLILDFEDFFPSFIYDERGRKDPFAPYNPVVKQSTSKKVIREGLLKYDLTELNVTTIIVGGKSKSKALVRDPENKTHVVFENDKIGRNNGVIRKIRAGQIVVIEEAKGKEGNILYTTKILSMKK